MRFGAALWWLAVDTVVDVWWFDAYVERMLDDLKPVRSGVEKWVSEGLSGPYDHTERHENGRDEPDADRACAVGSGGPSHH